MLETYPYEGTTASRPKSWDVDDPGIEGRIRRIIRSQAVTHDQIEAELNSFEIRSQRRSPSSFWSFIPALLLSGIMSKAVPVIDHDYQTNVGLVERYDGTAIDIGADEKDVERIYGEPLRKFKTKDGGTAWIYAYGEERPLQVNPLLRFGGLAVVCNPQGKVAAVYSNGFFCDAWLKPSPQI
jgi:hypothetical protein